MTDGRKIMWLWGAILSLLVVLLSLGQFMRWQRGSAASLAPVALSPTVEPTVEPTIEQTAPANAPEEAEESQQAVDEQAKLPDGMKLIIPVADVKPEQLRDTYADARLEGRAHNAIDIMAARDTPVLAAAEGEILRFFTSDKGGITLYQLSQDRKVVFYYAHLDHYAEGMAVGRVVQQGETIAYVGDTGNAAPGNYHLHFAVWLVEDPKRYWHGVNLNPYPLLNVLKDARAKPAP